MKWRAVHFSPCLSCPLRYPIWSIISSSNVFFLSACPYSRWGVPKRKKKKSSSFLLLPSHFSFVPRCCVFDPPNWCLTFLAFLDVGRTRPVRLSCHLISTSIYIYIGYCTLNNRRLDSEMPYNNQRVTSILPPGKVNKHKKGETKDKNSQTLLRREKQKDFIFLLSP